MPYTYLIGWSKYNKFYYGVRFAKNCHPSELCIDYFTSSKYVKEFIEENGLPDVIEIRKLFDNSDNARRWESKVLKRLKVVSKDIFINKTDNISISSECSRYEHTMEIRLKKSLSRIGKKHSKETIEKIRMSHKKIKDRPWLRVKRPEISEKMKGLFSGEKHPQFKGYYITPWGTFSSALNAKTDEMNNMTIQKYCEYENDKAITFRNMTNKYLSSLKDSPIGKTPKELGFYFVKK